MCRVLAQEEIQRFSDLFDTPGEIPQPEEFIKSESGRIYRLKKQELLTVPVVGDTRKPVSYTHLDVYKRQELIFPG